MPCTLANSQPIRFWCLAILFWALATTSFAKTFDESQTGQTEPGIVSVDVGFDRNAKLGKWLPISITTHEIQPVRFAVTAPDGGANRVTYRGELAPIGDDQFQAWVCIGRTHGNLEIELLDAEDQLLASHQVSLNSDKIKVTSSTSTQTITIGGNDTANAILSDAVSAMSDDPDSATIGLSRASQLPVHWLGYDGVNTVFVFSSDLELINNVSTQQWQALESWVMRGGQLFVSSNGSQGVLESGGPLSRFAVGEFSETLRLKSMVQLDNFTGKRLDAKTLSIARIKVSDGRIDLAQKGMPLIVRQSRGAGLIAFATFDLADPAFEDWKGLPVLFSKLLDSQDSDSSRRDKETGGSRASHLGYTDLAGQLKVPLEQFSKVQLINFTMVAVLIGLYLLAIGPGDFYLLKKVMGKMELTWVTFTLITLGFGALAITLASWSRPQAIQINQLEIIDIDATSNRFSGQTWTNIFSPKTTSPTIRFDASNELGLKSDSQLTGWLGSPGNSLGGMHTQAGFSTRQGSYEIVFEQSEQNDENEMGEPSTSLKEIPLQVSSSRALLTQWAGTFESKVESRLRFSGVQLEGQVTNPLDVELTNVRILFNNYVYILEKNLSGGETLDVSTGLRVRTLKSYMTGRTRDAETNDRAQNAPWDPASADISRIVDMMMFYSAAGGKDYTSLTHGFQNRVEMKDQMFCGRAVMVAQLKSNVGRIVIDGESSDELADQQTTLFRILLPVDKAR